MSSLSPRRNLPAVQSWLELAATIQLHDERTWLHALDVLRYALEESRTLDSESYLAGLLVNYTDVELLDLLRSNTDADLGRMLVARAAIEQSLTLLDVSKTLDKYFSPPHQHVVDKMPDILLIDLQVAGSRWWGRRDSFGIYSAIFRYGRRATTLRFLVRRFMAERNWSTEDESDETDAKEVIPSNNMQNALVLEGDADLLKLILQPEYVNFLTHTWEHDELERMRAENEEDELLLDQVNLVARTLLMKLERFCKRFGQVREPDEKDSFPSVRRIALHCPTDIAKRLDEMAAYIWTHHFDAVDYNVIVRSLILIVLQKGQSRFLEAWSDNPESASYETFDEDREWQVLYAALLGRNTTAVQKFLHHSEIRLETVPSNGWEDEFFCDCIVCKFCQFDHGEEMSRYVVDFFAAEEKFTFVINHDDNTPLATALANGNLSMATILLPGIRTGEFLVEDSLWLAIFTRFSYVTILPNGHHTERFNLLQDDPTLPQILRFYVDALRHVAPADQLSVPSTLDKAFLTLYCYSADPEHHDLEALNVLRTRSSFFNGVPMSQLRALIWRMVERYHQWPGNRQKLHADGKWLYQVVEHYFSVLCDTVALEDPDMHVYEGGRTRSQLLTFLNSMSSPMTQ